MKPAIDWEKITLAEAQQISDELCSAFSVTAKCSGSDEVRDVSYLTIACRYDDNFHSVASQRDCGISKLRYH